MSFVIHTKLKKPGGVISSLEFNIGIYFKRDVDDIVGPEMMSHFQENGKVFLYHLSILRKPHLTLF